MSEVLCNVLNSKSSKFTLTPVSWVYHIKIAGEGNTWTAVHGSGLSWTPIESFGGTISTTKAGWVAYDDNGSMGCNYYAAGATVISRSTENNKFGAMMFEYKIL